MFYGCQEIIGNIVMMVTNNEIYPYICYDCLNITTDNNLSEDFIKINYNIPNTSGGVGWITQLGYDSNHPDVRLPSAIGGTNTTGYADAVQTENLSNISDYAKRELLTSGVINYGQNNGIFYTHVQNPLSWCTWYHNARLSALGRSAQTVSTS